MSSRFFPALILLLSLSMQSTAQTLAATSPLPPVTIVEKGEVLLDGEEFSYGPWNSDNSPGKVHVLQYFAGTMRASKLFEPFTDKLKAELDYTKFHITTIVNLDASLWGTTGFVVAEVKASKKKYPKATIVLDAEGIGAEIWELGKKGAVLAVLDKDGVVQYLTRSSMSAEEMESTLALVRAGMDS
ncbi:MAG: YtfJ family protein [Halieaceae bacterium]